MSLEHWERRYACALGMAIYIHVTRDNLFMTFFGMAMCMIFAFMPAIQKWAANRTERRRS